MKGKIQASITFTLHCGSVRNGIQKDPSKILTNTLAFMFQRGVRIGLLMLPDRMSKNGSVRGQEVQELVNVRGLARHAQDHQTKNRKLATGK